MNPSVEVFCNGAAAAGRGRPLRLEYRPGLPGRNIRLGLPRLVQGVYHVPARTLDLLEIAAYVYAADRLTQRGGKDAVEYHAWARRFHFHVRVRDATFWRRPDVQDALASCLVFMTGDADFTFTFSGGHNTPPTSLFDQAGFQPPSRGTRPQIALFSGGLDSLSGALDTLASSACALVLVSHQSQPGTRQVQRGLASALSGRFPDRVKPYGFECTLSGLRASEETQRSRSFLYSAIGYAIAEAHSSASLLLALIVVSLGGSYVGAGGLSSPPPPAAMSLDSSMGAALKGYRTTFALSQAQLAALSHVSATRISRLERGLDSGTTAEQDSLARALWRVFRTRYDPGTEARLARIVLRTRP